MANLIDMKYKTFGFLTVIGRAQSRKTPNGQIHTMWTCKCECGNICVVDGYKLRSGHTSSCGCKRGYLITQSLTRHGMSGGRLHSIWMGMRRRCQPNYHESKYYFDRGIKVCNEWENSFESFRDWALTNGYSEELTIDRINNNKGYSPENCRWADKTVQASNRRCCHRYLVDGEVKTASQMVRELRKSRKRIMKEFKEVELQDGK